MKPGVGQLLKTAVTAVAGRRTKWLALAAWIALAAAATGIGGRLSSVENNDAATYLPADAESTREARIESAAFGGGQQTLAVVVFVRAGGITDGDRSAVEHDRQLLAQYADGPVGPAVSSTDGEAILVTLPLTSGFQVVDTVKRVRQVLRGNNPPGLQVKVTGPAGLGADLGGAFTNTNVTLLLVAVSVVAMLLLITYRSPVLWLIPLLSVVIASQFASAIVYLLAKSAGLVVSGFSASILDVLVLGVSTDYALLLLARYREELRHRQDRHEAMAAALVRSAPAIFASAATVAIAMLCLVAAEMNSTRGLGPVAAIGVVAAFLTVMTLTPALLVILGRWVFWPFVPRYSETVAGTSLNRSGFWSRVAVVLEARRRLLWLGTATVLGLLALSVTGLRTGLSEQEMFTTTPESVVGQSLLAAHFSSGTSDPVVVLARSSAAYVVVKTLQDTDGVAAVSPAQTSGDWVRFEVEVAAAPGSDQAGQAIDRIRDAVHQLDDARALVGGPAAITHDTNLAFAHDEEVAIPLVLAIVLIVLALLLRALIAPLVLLASVVLSYIAALGASGLLFRSLGHAHIDQSLVLYGFVFLVALGVDYTIFLMTRVREEVARVGHSRGLLEALVVTGGVITSAGAVLAGTFAALGVLPVVSFLQLGLMVALGIAIDTFIVRTVLVPSLALDIGPSIWWPSRQVSVTSAIGPSEGN